MDILNSIPVLSEVNPVKPVSLEDIQRIHSSLTLENPITYKKFLTKRPEIGEAEKNKKAEAIEIAAQLAEVKAKATARQAIADRLGLTADELAILLG